MIRPRLPKVASGTRLTTNLVNNIINRTEYAADLLRQYKLVAGTEMYVEPHYDGTRVSYLQPVAGGATPTKPIERDVYRVLTGNGIVYEANLDDGFALTSADFGTFGVPQTYGLRKNYILGYGFKDSTQQQTVGIIYNGVSGTTAQYPNSEWTEFWDIDPINYNTIVGSYFGPPDYDYNGLIYNLSSGQFSQFNRPNQDTTGTFLTGIYNGIIIGGQAFGLENSFYYDGGFNFLPDNFFPYGIWETTIVGADAKIYKIGQGFIRQLVIPELGQIDATSIYKNYVCGYTASFPFHGYVYDLNTDKYQIRLNTQFWAIG